MNAYALGQCEAALLFGLDKEAAFDFLGPEGAKLIRRALLAVPLATGAGMSQLPPPARPQPAHNIAYEGTPLHYKNVQLTRGKALMAKVKAEQAAAADVAAPVSSVSVPGVKSGSALLKEARDDFFDRQAEKYILSRRPKWDRANIAKTFAGSFGLNTLLGVPALVGDYVGTPSPVSVTEIADKMGVTGLKHESGPIAAYFPASHRVVSPLRASEATLAHEVGHAKGKGRGLLQDLAVRTGRPMSRMNSLAEVYSAGVKKPSMIPGALQLVGSVPQLAEEARASGHALRYLFKEHGVAKGLQKGLSLAPAFGTYLQSAVSPLAIAAYRRRSLARETQQLARKLRIGTGLGGAALAAGLAHHFLSKKED